MTADTACSEVAPLIVPWRRMAGAALLLGWCTLTTAAVACPTQKADTHLSQQLARLRTEVATQKYPDYGRASRAWAAAVQTSLDQHELQVDQSVADAICVLGPPSREEVSDSQRVYHWYFQTPMHVNPILSMLADGDRVRGFRMDRR